MIVRDSQVLPQRALSTDFILRELVAVQDDVGFLVVDAKIKAGCLQEHLEDIQGAGWNHIYYCINGLIKITSKGRCFELGKDCVLAVAAGIEASLEAVQDSWMMITYSKQIEDHKASEPVNLTLGDIIGGERDVDWTQGLSRRFLLAKDGFGVTLTNTIAYPNFDCVLEYKNHIESAYWIDGKGKYSWNDGKSSQEVCLGRQGEGVTLLMDQHDKHKAMFYGDKDSVALCVFYPALVGAESHKFDGKGSSSY